jgi:hypothetical protein
MASFQVKSFLNEIIVHENTDFCRDEKVRWGIERMLMNDRNRVQVTGAE